jgi:hypothetical protein
MNCRRMTTSCLSRLFMAASLDLSGQKDYNGDRNPTYYHSNNLSKRFSRWLVVHSTSTLGVERAVPAYVSKVADTLANMSLKVSTRMSWVPEQHSLTRSS